MIAVTTASPTTITQLVKSFWYLEVERTDIGSYREEIVPDGHHEIIFHIGPDPGRLRLGDAVAWQEEPRAMIVGQTFQKHHLWLAPGARLYGIRFFPHTLLAFLRLPVAELTNQVYPLESITQVQPFWDCIASDPRRTFRNFETLLTRLLRPDAINSAGYDYVNAAVAAILHNGGQVSGAGLIRRTGVSKTHLDQLFLKYVGISPKLFSRIIQLNAFIAYRTKHPDQTLTQCSYETGYYDQSHLTRSFRSFVGRPPRAYFDDTNEISDIFSSL